MSRYLRYLVPLGLFAVLVAFLFRGLSLDPKLVPSPLVGKPMPAFSLTRLDDPNTTISDADIKGKVAVLNIWATWCSSCRAEHDVLLQLAKTGQVAIYGLNYKDNRADAQRWLRRWPGRYQLGSLRCPGDLCHRPAGYHSPQACRATDHRGSADAVASVDCRTQILIPL
jgi:cytochrome c biogenesis protein CcmG/thiol:disulfide interchange protein DsbE